jgi:hypothetical protein
MLAAVRWRAVLVGFGLGVLGIALLAILIWLVLAALGVDDAGGVATAFATVGGFVLAGWLAGRRAPIRAWFHGALAAMGIALVVVVTARLGGSPAPTGQVLLLAGMAIGLGGFAGHLAGRRPVAP